MRRATMSPLTPLLPLLLLTATCRHTNVISIGSIGSIVSFVDADRPATPIQMRPKSNLRKAKTMEYDAMQYAKPTHEKREMADRADKTEARMTKMMTYAKPAHEIPDTAAAIGIVPETPVKTATMPKTMQTMTYAKPAFEQPDQPEQPAVGAHAIDAVDSAVDDAVASKSRVVQLTQQTPPEVEAVEAPSAESSSETRNLRIGKLYAKAAFADNGMSSVEGMASAAGNPNSAAPASTDIRDQIQAYTESKIEWPPRDIVDAVADSQKRVVVIGVNCGFIDMADNFLNSLVKLSLTNFLIVPMDTKSHTLMSAAYPGHVVPVIPELQGVELQTTSEYQSEGFKILTSIRPTFLLKFLEMGYSIFYNDVDMVWRRNVFDSLMELNQNKALLVPGKGGEYGDGACTSTIFMKPTRVNIEFVRAWKREMNRGIYDNDQFGFNAVLNTQVEGRRLREEGIVWGKPDEFPTAKAYFHVSSTLDKDVPYIVHNNGLTYKEEKIMRFQRFKLWELSGRVEEGYVCDASPKKVGVEDEAQTEQSEQDAQAAQPSKASSSQDAAAAATSTSTSSSQEIETTAR